MAEPQRSQGGFCAHTFSHARVTALRVELSLTEQGLSHFFPTIPRLPLALWLSQLTPALSSAVCPEHVGSSYQTGNVGANHHTSMSVEPQPFPNNESQHFICHRAFHPYTTKQFTEVSTISPIFPDDEKAQESGN